jgi:predicted dehydrogenase
MQTGAMAGVLSAECGATANKHGETGVSDSTPIRIGILGAARIAPAAVVYPARRMSNLRVEAVAARSVERAQSFADRYGIARVAESYDALVADGELDAIYIPAPNSLHLEWSLKALAAGKDVLCEKPLTSNAAEAEVLLAAARSRDRLVTEAFHYRYHPVAQRMHEIVRSGELGPIVAIQAVMRTPSLHRDDIRFHAELSGGATMDLGCYAINLMRWLTGVEPVVESATAVTMAPQVDRRMRALLRFAGAPATMDCEMRSLTALDLRMVVTGERGQLTVINPWLPQLFCRFTVNVAGRMRRENFARQSTYARQLRAFAEAVRSRAAMPTDVADAVYNMRVIDQIYLAAGMKPRGT